MKPAIVRIVKPVTVLLLLLTAFTWPATVAAQVNAGNDNTRRIAADSVSQLRSALVAGNAGRSAGLYRFLDSLVSGNAIKDSLLLSDIYYYMGAYNAYVLSDFNLSYGYFLNSVKNRESMGIRDLNYRKALTNIGTSLFYLGRFGEAYELYDSLILFIKEQDGPYSTDNIANYNNLASASNELKMYDKAISAAHAGIEIANTLGANNHLLSLANLYNNLGISFSRQNDYTKANLNMTKAYDIIGETPEMNIPLYLNIINSLTVINSRLGNTVTAETYYRAALPVAAENPGESSFLLLSNYALFLAGQGNTQRADSVFTGIMKRLLSIYGPSTRFRYEMLEKQASFLSTYNVDKQRALSILNNELLPYCESNQSDIVLIRDIRHTYATLLMRSGRLNEALVAIQKALFVKPGDGFTPEYDNPPPQRFIPDRTGLGLLKDKIHIFRELYSIHGDTVFLSKAIETGRKLVSAIETVRIGISEEESRILLGDNYRLVYNDIIADLNTLYKVSGNNSYFRLAFEYAERGKAASMLVSLREMKASQFLIPESLAAVERDLERQLGLIREMISGELSSSSPDNARLRSLRDKEYSITEKREELIARFEYQYPEYYAAKYNTSVAGADDILKKAGGGSTYINYVYSDTVLYIFVVNKKHRSLVTVPLESDFLSRLEEYRTLLLKPAAEENFREIFHKYSESAYYLYSKLIAPVRSMISTRRLIVSPDNVLTYIPFESLIATNRKRDDLLYRELDFLIKEFDISYTYSATMYVETWGHNRAFRNRALAFAPSYPERIRVDSVLNTRMGGREVLYDLPYARDEAEYVVSRLGGELFVNENAMESVYKARASDFPVIHLAMHAIINEMSPGYTKLIFNNKNDTIEDGLLNAYEIYATHINARMVVVSACNTGTGKLRAGEGVMSLARGFINAGSRSVIMSLWEVDDEWGAIGMELFYDNLAAGMNKSLALRKTKLSLLHDKQQFVGQPYYWSTLILYGNQDALFYDYKVIATWVLLTLVIIAAAVRAFFYFRSR